MTRLKVVVGYSVFACVASAALTYGIAQWVFRSIDRAVSQAFHEKEEA